MSGEYVPKNAKEHEGAEEASATLALALLERTGGELIAEIGAHCRERIVGRGNLAFLFGKRSVCGGLRIHGRVLGDLI
jgi:hypothetical protein